MNALDLMQKMESESNQTSIVVSSPSDVFLTSSYANQDAMSANTSTTPSTPPHAGSKVTTGISNAHPQKKHSTPTKKTSVGQRKPRTLSSSALSGPGSKTSNVHSSSGVTSPSHKSTLSSSSSVGSSMATGGGPRPRGSTYSSGTKSQILTPPGGPSPKTSMESVHSNTSRERKVASPNRTSTTSRTKT